MAELDPRAARECWQRAQQLAQETEQTAIERWSVAGLPGLLRLQRELWAAGDRAIAERLERADCCVACDRGCDWCCYLNVPIAGLEAQVIADWIAELPMVQRRLILERLAQTLGQLELINPGDRLGHKIPCAFLEPDGTCGIYSVRPATCRSHYSTCAADCQQGWETGQWPARSGPINAQTFDLEAQNAGLQAACVALAIPLATGELHQALGMLMLDRPQSRNNGSG